MTSEFQDSIVAVTGAAIGIGAAAARAFSRAGAQVYLLDIDDERGLDVATGVGEYLHCDVTSTSEVSAAFATIDEVHDRLDVLVNNAGGFWQQHGVEDTTDNEWDQVMDLNLKGPFLCARAAIPLLRRSSAPRIVNVGSLAGQTTMYRSSPPYAAAKAGVHALSRVLAYELAADGITSNSIAPSAIATERIAHVRGPEERAKTAASLPVGRYGTPEEVVAAIMFLASAGSGYITGQTLSVNGGRFMT